MRTAGRWWPAAEGACSPTAAAQPPGCGSPESRWQLLVPAPALAHIRDGAEEARQQPCREGGPVRSAVSAGRLHACTREPRDRGVKQAPAAATCRALSSTPVRFPSPEGAAQGHLPVPGGVVKTHDVLVTPTAATAKARPDERPPSGWEHSHVITGARTEKMLAPARSCATHNYERHTRAVYRLDGGGGGGVGHTHPRRRRTPRDSVGTVRTLARCCRGGGCWRGQGRGAPTEG